MGRSKVLVGGMLVAVVALQGSVAFAKPLSPKQWKKQGNAICKAVNQEIDLIGEEIFAGLAEDQEPTVEQLEAYADGFIPLIDDGLDQLTELEPPKKYRKSAQQFVDAVDEVLATIDADPAGVLLGDSDPFTEADVFAKKAGLKACAS